MSKLRVHNNNCSFTLEGEHFFYLADTVWSAFTNATLEEWDFYLEKRRSQGFTVLQINTLPQWDRCMSELHSYPFATEDENRFEFGTWNQDYYDRARTMCQMAVDKGFQLALVVLWLNYVPGTWGSRMSNNINVMPKNMLETYAKKVVENFEEYDPIYIVSGDTDFDTPEAIEYYETVLDVLCKESPDSLKTMHIKRGYDYIPEQFLDRMDFYMFQSGHNPTAQEMAYVLPEIFRKKYPKKPLLNGEPCYEQMGYSGNAYGRFETRDIRKAAWSSLLSGACAGITYGAHGVWNWQKLNQRKNSLIGEGFDGACPVQEAMEYPGAWDYGFIRNFFSMKRIENLIPCQEVLEDKSTDIRIARTEENDYILYVPYTTRLTLNIPLQDHKAIAYDLDQNRIANLELEKTELHTTIPMNPFGKDVIVYLYKGTTK